MCFFFFFCFFFLGCLALFLAVLGAFASPPSYAEVAYLVCLLDNAETFPGRAFPFGKSSEAIADMKCAAMDRLFVVDA